MSVLKQVKRTFTVLSNVESIFKSMLTVLTLEFALRRTPSKVNDHFIACSKLARFSILDG